MNEAKLRSILSEMSIAMVVLVVWCHNTVHSYQMIERVTG